MAVDRSIRILLVEDSKITRKMEIKALNEVGFHNVVEADDGDEAVEKLLAETGIQLIMSDWNMPNRDGFQLLEWVRSNEKYRGTPFIMATARGEKKQTAKASEAGVSSFITKPFTPAELDNTIEKTFQRGDGSVVETHDTSRSIQTAASGKLRLNVAHIQITDHLTLGAMKHLIDTGKLAPQTFDLETRCMMGWNPVQQALENGEVDAALVLAPIAMDLFGYGVPIKLVLLAHKSGSICVQKRGGASKQSLRSAFRNKTFYVPHAMSIHHMLVHMFLREIGLKPGVAGKADMDADVAFEVIAPIKMAEALAGNPDASGFMVAEPIGTKAIAEGIANLLFLSGELWENHPCCVLAVRDEVIKERPDAVQEFTNMLVEAGRFIYQRPDTAAEIGVSFLDPNKTLGLRAPILKNVLKEPNGIRTNDLFPVAEDFERIQKYMVGEMGIGSLIDIGKFIDPQFADIACKGTMVARRRSTMKDISTIALGIMNRQDEGASGKMMLGREGKYLFFTLDEQEYGIGIFSVREVIRMIPVRSIPHLPEFIKGVINLRGKVIPLVDLRLKFGLTETVCSERTCIIVLDMPGANGVSFLAAIVVDSVSEVINIKAVDIEDSVFLGDVKTKYILGMAKMGTGVKILLNGGRLFNESESRVVSAIT